MNDIKILTIDNKEYPIEIFSDQTKRLIDVRSIWTTQLEQQRLEVIKTETAIKAIDAELIKTAVKDLESNK